MVNILTRRMLDTNQPSIVRALNGLFMCAAYNLGNPDSVTVAISTICHPLLTAQTTLKYSGSGRTPCDLITI